MDDCFLLFVCICVFTASFCGDEDDGFWNEGIKPDCLLQQPASLSLCKLYSKYTLWQCATELGLNEV